MDVKIRMLVSMAGADESYKPGDELMVRPDVADAWKEAGIATPVEGATAPEPSADAATVPATEAAAPAASPDAAPTPSGKRTRKEEG